jgi:hypothetical protein
VNRLKDKRQLRFVATSASTQLDLLSLLSGRFLGSPIVAHDAAFDSVGGIL